MRIEIKTKNVKQKNRVQNFVAHKIQSATNRLSSRIKTIRVRLEDNSKSQSEFVGQCRIEVQLNPKGRVHVAARGDSIYECIVNAVRKMEHTVKSDIDRHRSSARIRHKQNRWATVEHYQDAMDGEPAIAE